MRVYRNDTITVNRYWVGNDIYGQARRATQNRYFSLKVIRLSLVLCCCLAIVIFAIGLITDGYSFPAHKQPIVHLTGGTASLIDDIDAETDIRADPAAQEQSDTSQLFIQGNADKTPAQNTANNTEWYLLLVNKWNRIPDHYEVELTKLSNGQSVDKRIYPALQEMFDTARRNGIYPIATSGYRTAEEQQSLLDKQVAYYKGEGNSAEMAMTRAEARVAVPGTSEHQLGIAVDINADGTRSTGEEVYEWLRQNSYKFGFIRRYSADKAEITGVSNEPWHYRYVGTAAAAEMYAKGICLEEYLLSQ